LTSLFSLAVLNLAANLSPLSAMSAEYELFEPPNDAISAVVFHSSKPEVLMVSSWDKVISFPGDFVFSKYIINHDRWDAVC